MADASSPLQQQFFAQALGITPEQQQKLMAAQQQEAMANMLLQEGSKPIDTNNRSIGGVATKISPLEGLAKMAQILSGKAQQGSANEALANALSPQPGQQSSGSSSSDPIVAAMPGSTQALFNRLSLPEAMGGSPRAAMELYNTYAAGMKGYNTGVGTAAAGNVPVGTMPPGVSQQPPQMAPPPAIGGGMPVPPQPPVQGPQQLPGAPYDAAADYRQQNGMATPPIDPQRASMGLPIGSNVPMGAPNPSQVTNAAAPQAPPVSAQQLQPPMPPPPPTGGTAPIPAPVAAMPSPLPGESNNQYEARIAAAKAGGSSQAEDTGKNLADATKTYNVAASNLPRAMQRFEQLRQASKNASYGGGVSDQEPEQGFFEHFLPGPDYARNYARTSMGQITEPKTALANQTISQASQQGILAELGPQLAGLRGNKFLEGIASGASGLNAADPPTTKVNAINGLQDQYISNMKSLAEQRRQYGDPTAPSDMNLAQMISQNAAPTSMISVVDPQGKLARVPAVHLPDLIKAGGQIR